jgi:lipoate-protein ligase A
MTAQWLESGPGDPVANMDYDGALFDAARDGRAADPVVRVYSWGAPAVTVGRLQNIDAVRQAYPNRLLVRRVTGGRAVVHGSDLTIAVVARDDHLPASARGVMPFYRAVAGAIVCAFSAVGIASALARPRRAEKSPDRVDCFAWAAGCDIVDTRTGRKLAGCAQRREGGAVVLQASLPGMVEGAGNPSGPQSVNHDVFVAALKAALAEALGIDAWTERQNRTPVVIY